MPTDFGVDITKFEEYFEKFEETIPNENAVIK